MTLRKKLLIIRLSSLGDCLLTTPIIRSLKKQYTDLQIDFLTKKNYEDVFKYNPRLNRLLLYDGNNFQSLRKEIIQNKYDAIVDLHNNLISNLLTLGSNVKKYKYRSGVFAKFLFVKFKINLLKDYKSVPRKYAEVLPDLNLDSEGLEIFIPENIKSRLEKSRNYIAFAPGARHFTKRWPPEYFIQLGKSLISKNFKIILLGGKDDKAICDIIHDELKNSINLSGENNLLQLAADLKSCTVLVSNDSGLMHLACATKTPVVAIFGSTVKEFGFSPYKNKNIIIENESLKCRPCSQIGKEKCPKKHFKCMIDLTPDIVEKNLNIILHSF